MSGIFRFIELLPKAGFTIGILALAACALAQQQPVPPAAPPVLIKATTRLVMMSVIARDKNDKPAADLTKDDFKIKVNGKVQPITVFSVESTGQLPAPSASARKAFSPATPLGTLPPNIFSNRLAVQSGTPSGVNVILLDSRNTNITDQLYAKAQVVRYLRTLQPTDHIGLYTFGPTLKVLHDYTSDSASLLAQLNSVTNLVLPDTSNQDALGALRGDGAVIDDMMRTAGDATLAERAFYTTDEVLSTLYTLEFIAEHLAQLPGRKNLIWVSGGFPLDIHYDSLTDWKNPMMNQRSFLGEVDHTLRAMNEANIAIYPVDARGLMTDPRYSGAPRAGSKPREIAQPVGAKDQEVMKEMANRTGGLAFYNTNELSLAIHSAVQDSEVTYTIGFYPTDPGFDGRFHRIDVETERSGVKLRYRKGYFDVLEKTQDDKLRQAELRDAVWSPIDASAVGIVAMVKPVANDPASLDVTLRVDHATVGLSHEKDHWQGRLDILFVQRDDQGTEYGGTDDQVNLNLSEDTYRKVLVNDIGYHRAMPRASAAKLLRIVVRDSSSGAMGSVTVPLDKVK